MAGKSKKLKIKKLQINFTNRWLYTLIVFFSLVVVGVFVYAAVGTTPNPGHPITTLQPCNVGGEILKSDGNTWTCGTDEVGISEPSGCSANQFLKWTGSAWTCEAVSSGLWNSFSSGIYYDNGDVNIYDNTNPGLAFGDAFGNSLKAGVSLDLTAKFLNIGDYMAQEDDIGIRFYTDDVERMRIDKDGNVGIGTTTPKATLEVDGIFSFGEPTILIPNVDGEITITRSFHKLDTRGGYPEDTLDTINGGEDGMILILQTYRAARDVTLKERTSANGGNMYIISDSFTLNTAVDKIVLIKSGAYWAELSRSSNL